MEKRFIFSLVVLVFCLWVKAENHFTLATKGEIFQSLPVNVTTNTDYVFSPFSSINNKKAITGLSIDGNFTRNSKHYLVRVLLKDIEGREYLIMESYKEINDKSSDSFSNYCEETRYLNHIQPDSIKIILRGASIQLTKIHYVDSEIMASRSDCTSQKDNKESRKVQVEDIVKKINTYNLAHNKLWRAGVTGISLKSYEDKKRILGFDDSVLTGGMEYYADGIFEIGDIEDAPVIQSKSSLLFVDGFDWREQHGKNWITPIKDQGDSGYCSAFAAVSVTEAMTRLYYNQLINIDLSEQEAACCNGTYDPWDGMTLSAPLRYIRDYGVCDESVYPFVNSSSASNCRSSEITPNELITIGGYNSVVSSEDSMKDALIKHGPLSSSIYYWGNTNVPDSIFEKHHAMTIVGYGKLQVGDTVYHWVEDDGFLNGAFTVSEGDPHIGMTYWIYKDNYVDGEPARQGYRYYIHYNYNKSVTGTYYILPQISSMHYSDNDIVCEDADGDGYYFWGLGNKPSWCPEWVPDIKDGDESNCFRGKMYLESPNIIGDFELLYPNTSSTLQITGNTAYNTRQSIYTHIRIPSSATLTVQNILNLFGRVTITIESGGELVIDGGVITNADIDIASGGKLTIKNGGKLIMRTNTDFDAPIGALVEIENGEICRSNDF